MFSDRLNTTRSPTNSPSRRGRIVFEMFSKMLKRKNRAPRRQWGTEKSSTPLLIIHPVPSTAKLALGRIAIVLTVAFWVMYIFSIIVRQLFDGPQSYDFTMEAFGYAFVVSVLTFSSLVYLITRQGALERFSRTFA